MAPSACTAGNPVPDSAVTSPHASHGESAGESGAVVGKNACSGSIPLHTPPSRSETSQTRSTRSTSTTSRNSNRLSLTLPIAPPNSFPSRPTPTSSMPPTPIETPSLKSPDTNEYISAIAAQERRVLEIREELARAEHELRKLRKMWMSSASYKEVASRKVDPLRAMAATLESQWALDESSAVKPPSELERRKAILLAQSQRAPREHKRTVIRGGHARTLSLLSPTMPTTGDADGLRSADLYSKVSQSPMPSPAPLNKRATWAPRQSQPSNNMQLIANELKQGLWTFVEDLRQATVGDEAISGTTNRTTEIVSRLGRMEDDQDTIRASASNRGRIPTQDESDPAETPGRASTGSFSDRYQHRRTTSKPEPKTKKRFSWTPLTFDSFDDDDWSNWESPNVKTARWSGSTVNGDIITAIPERTHESEGTLRRKQSRSELRSPSPPSPSPQAILNRLTPSNIIKEWEKSLSSPEEPPSLI
ncbi:uncharacterized protein GGS25DRAFT_521985 [Hypoxylon fragiforme]|uniref:uncharacterized protein n=1 Tax=Hypoxylon fragiforme TaxID=63214 RepID=UPI0020C6CBC5|nr:uncharacterized protein GGS25DRAFT_521985 [Hypoxylon fragiforme]KAI2608811.1 hypothetical protein GGS25DRAFT_521985 [Hypoxylon fragiforme]